MPDMKTHNSSKNLPKFWRFIWMFWMQPISLHYRLKAVEIDPEASFPSLLMPSDNRENNRQYLYYQTLLLGILMPSVVFFSLFLLQLQGFDINWNKVALGVAVGVALGVAVGVALEVALGVAFGVAEGVALGVALGVDALGVDAFGVDALGVAFGVALGVALGVAFGVAEGVALGVAVGVAFGVALGVAFGVAEGVAEGVALGVAFGAAVGVAGGVAFLLIYLRIWIYFFEFLYQIFAYFTQPLSRALAYSPLFWHELSYLPLPFLAKMIYVTAESDLHLSRRALEHCAMIPGQKRIGERCYIQLQSQELEQHFQQQNFEALATLTGNWLPNRSPGHDPSLQQFSQIGRYLHAYQVSLLNDQQLQHLHKAEQHVRGLRNHLLSKKSLWTPITRQPLKEWQTWIAAEIATVQAQADQQLPNPFRYGQPLSPEMGEEVFCGRDAIARKIEQLLVHQQQNVSIALLSPRRCGKSSLLKMLPSLLPDSIVVFYDLQDNTVDSVAGFFRTLAQQVLQQAYQDRAIKLPALPEGSAFEAGQHWFKILDQHLTQPLLICMDEFERLPALFPGTEQQLLQLMSLFRATIQNRRYVRLLVAGVAPFDELESLWNDHFINVQVIKMPHLDRHSSLALVQSPIAAFPTATLPKDVADYLFSRTQGQPYLLQAFAGTTVEHLNEHQLSTAHLDMLPAIEEEVLRRCNAYFRNIYFDAPPAAQQYLNDLSHPPCNKLNDQPNDKTIESIQLLELDPISQRWLQTRLLISAQGTLTMPIFARWIREFSQAF